MEAAVEQSSVVEDESFVILGSSPSHLYSHINIEGSASYNETKVPDISITTTKVESAVDEKLPSLSNSVSPEVIWKTHFKLQGENSPSSSSLALANSIVTENLSIEQIRLNFGEILDENLILKDTLKRNSDSTKEQFRTIASWQEDMMNTHKLHKHKFEETKQLVTKLRTENQQMRQELECLRGLLPNKKLEQSLHQSNTDVSGNTNNIATTSIYEYIVDRDEDTIDKLTAQIELVEKQRRQVITENEKLHWQIESMDGTIDLLSKDNEQLKKEVQDLTENLTKAEAPRSNDFVLRVLEDKIATLHTELKSAQVKILELENIKLGYSVQKNDTNELIKHLKMNIQELQTRLREAHTVVFQPVRYSVSLEADCEKIEFSNFDSDVKLYDRTLKHLSEFLNLNSRSVCEVCEAVNTCLIATDDKVRPNLPAELNEGLSNLMLIANSQQNGILEHKSQIKATLTIFEKIFQNYQDILKLLKTERNEKASIMALDYGKNEMLGAAEREMALLRGTVAGLNLQTDENEALKAQLEIYRSDFEAERISRQEIAGENERLTTELRLLQRRYQLLHQEMESVQRNHPHITISHNKLGGVSTTSQSSVTSSTMPNQGNSSKLINNSPPLHLHTCPICDKAFKSLQLLEEHVGNCLDTAC